jgi:hypothetical protein
VLAPEAVPFNPPEFPFAAVAVPSTSTGPVAEAAVDRSTPGAEAIPEVMSPAVAEVAVEEGMFPEVVEVEASPVLAEVGAVTFQRAEVVEAVAVVEEDRFPQAEAAEVVRIQAPAADVTSLLVEAPILVSGSNQPKPQPSPLGRRWPT